MITVGIDYTPAHEQGGGIGRYVRELTAALMQLNPPDQRYKLFVAGVQRGHLTQLPHDFSWHPTPLSTKWLARIWHRARLPLPVELMTGPVDIYHSTDFVLPPTRRDTRTLLTIHDLSFIHSPETASPRLRRYLSEVVPRSVGQADHILADSEATRQDIMAAYQVPASKITVLLSGVHPRFRPIEDSQAQQKIREKYNIGTTPYIFSIGTVQPRKNYARLVEALALLHDQGLELNLVIAGGHGWLEDSLYTALDQFKMRNYVKLIGYADDEDLPTLYSAASCASFVTLYEGFGLPVLESMACGTPVITSNVSSLPEVAGDAAPMLTPTDTTAIAAALRRIIEDKNYHDTLREKGLARAATFTWSRSAQQLADIYRRMREKK